jgi:hypothetical protein
MKRSLPCAAPFSFSSTLLALSSVIASQGAQADVSDDFAAEVDIYNDHVVTLASPWMEGRLPGTRGMELAKEYMEFYFKKTGLETPWD